MNIVILLAVFVQYVHGYYFVRQSMTWSNAQQYCQNNYGTDLASYSTQEEKNALDAGLASMGTHLMWIGLNDLAWEGRWVNQDGSAVAGGLWCPGEPNNLGGEDCAHFGWCNRGNTHTMASLNDIRCSVSHFFACNGDPQPTPDTLCTAVNTIPGTPCYVWGDPHTRTFDGGWHDFQGQPATGLNQFYYVRRCNNVTLDDMPFSLLGTHYSWGGRVVSGLDYVTLEMLDSDGALYYAYFSSSFQMLAAASSGATSDYDDNLANGITMSPLTAGATAIGTGNRFILTYTMSGIRVYVTLTVQGLCDFEFDMYGYANYVNGRWRMHNMFVQVPTCYKCATCGLCGGLKGVKSTGLWQQMERCDGSIQQYRRGASTSITEAYDVHGWSWEKGFVEQNCAADVNAATGYVEETANPNTGNPWTPTDPCDAAIKPLIVAACDQVELDYGACCAVTGDVCTQMVTGCETDACIKADGDPLQVAAAVQSTTIDQLDKICNDNTLMQEFDPVNEEFPAGVTATNPLPPITVTGCETFGVSHGHVCGCQAEECSGGVCNTVIKVAKRLDVSPKSATCPTERSNCCCSCPNCKPYLELP